jgi:hypothetical protein
VTAGKRIREKREIKKAMERERTYLVIQENFTQFLSLDIPFF